MDKRLFKFDESKAIIEEQEKLIREVKENIINEINRLNNFIDSFKSADEIDINNKENFLCKYIDNTITNTIKELLTEVRDCKNKYLDKKCQLGINGANAFRSNDDEIHRKYKLKKARKSRNIKVGESDIKF